MWTQTDGLNGYLGHRGTLVLGGVWNPCYRLGAIGIDRFLSDREPFRKNHEGKVNK